MRNRALALAADFIPYIKELRQVTGSVTAAILMQQLDFRFYGKPSGFYKFLAPCKNAAYKEGDSWIEELGFSEEEFRTAFDKIGLRYESKKAYDATTDAFIDKDGKEYFYASYHDKIRGLTIYFRNHELVDRTIDELFKKMPTLETGNANLRKPTIPAYVTQQSQATELGNPNLEYRNTDITTDITTEKPAPPAPSVPSVPETPVEIYKSIFKDKALIYAEDLIESAGIEDLALWRERVQAWFDNRYSTRNIAGLISSYKERAQKAQKGVDHDEERRRMAKQGLERLTRDWPAWVRSRREAVRARCADGGNQDDSREGPLVGVPSAA